MEILEPLLCRMCVCILKLKIKQDQFFARSIIDPMSQELTNLLVYEINER